MNPMLAAIKGGEPRQSGNLSHVINDVKAGKIKPRSAVLDLLAGNPAMRDLLQSNMPRLVSIAKAAGISDAEISAFKAEANLR